MKKKVTWAYFSVSAMRSWVRPALAITSGKMFLSSSELKATGRTKVSS